VISCGGGERGAEAPGGQKRAFPEGGVHPVELVVGHRYNPLPVSWRVESAFIAGYATHRRGRLDK